LADELASSVRIVRAGDVFMAAEHFHHAAHLLLEAIARFHEMDPLVPGINREELRSSLRFSTAVFAAVVARSSEEKKVEEMGEQLRLSGRGVTLKDDEAQARRTIEDAFASAGLKVPAMKEVLASLPLDKTRAHKIVTLLLRDRILIKLADDLVFHATALNALRQAVRAYKAQSPTIDVAGFKELTAISRKYAIPLLEFLDRERITRRQGDLRVIL
jgi:selenocysteine-specific elongation factor